MSTSYFIDERELMTSGAFLESKHKTQTIAERLRSEYVLKFILLINAYTHTRTTCKMNANVIFQMFQEGH